MQKIKNSNTKSIKGFTLLELLVVVLIIGILAAIALPQYKVAVTKSKYATLKNITNSILDAEDRFYMTNGNYTNDFSKLDIDVGGEYAGKNLRSFPGGYCQITLYDQENNNFYILCRDTNIKMGYQVYPKHVIKGAKECVYSGTDKSSAQYKVCSQETKHQAYKYEGGYYWLY